MLQRFECRRVGNTSLSVPTFGFGAGQLGELFSIVPEADASAVIDAAWDAGIRLFDTAPWYGLGLSEHRLGYGLRHRPRGDYKLITKVGRVLKRPSDPIGFKSDTWLGGLPFEHRFDYTYDGVMRSYEQSMMRLGMNSIDLLVIHDLDAAHHGDELPAHQKDLICSGMKALQALKSCGEISAVGMGINTLESLDTFAPIVDLDFVLVAMHYTLLDQNCLHSLAACMRRGVSVIIGAPLASGILATGSACKSSRYGYAEAPEAIRLKVRKIEQVCSAYNIPLPAAALQFVLAHPAVISEVPGALRPSEVEQNVASHFTSIPHAFWADLKSLALIDAEAPVPD